MSNYLRENAWDANNGGQFEDSSGQYTDLYWYAKAVQIMQSRPISDPTSWWFYAAIHGEYVLSLLNPPYEYLNWKNISYINPSANLNLPPSKNLTDTFWDQCQHGTWFFPPWHRGYLVALENILRDIITNQLSGPSGWALPYWNYLNQSTTYSEFKIPPAFTVKSLPDGTDNPLFVPERYGPHGDGNIYVPVGQGQNSANDECQWDNLYEESSKEAKPGPGDLYGYFYGGGETGFSHSSSETGDLEANPHNFVHGQVGGANNNNKQHGLMGVPATAALDPIFFLHHANIDRMWAAWNVTGGNNNPSTQNWLSGPAAQGDRHFVMPLDSNGTGWSFTPEDVQNTENVRYDGSTYAYTYDDLSLTSYDTTPPSQLRGNVLERFKKLGVTDLTKSIQMPNKRNHELVGASSGSLTLTGRETKTNVKLNTSGWKSVAKSLLTASVSTVPDEVYLQLEGVKGGSDSNFLSVYVNQTFVKSVSLFGLLHASFKGSTHENTGLNFKFNITNIIDDLHLDKNIDVDSLNVEIKAKNELSADTEITISRIGIYRISR